MSNDETATDRLMRRLKDNRIVAFTIVVALGLGAVTDFWEKVASPVVEYFGPDIISKPEPDATVSQKRLAGLKRIQNLLEANRAIYDELSVNYLRPGWGVQESYFLKARASGVNSQAIGRARIDELVSNNKKIITILEEFELNIQDNEFSRISNNYIAYASKYNSGWNGVKELSANSPPAPMDAPLPEDFPTANETFPQGFPVVIESEIAKMRQALGA